MILIHLNHFVSLSTICHREENIGTVHKRRRQLRGGEGGAN